MNKKIIEQERVEMSDRWDMVVTPRNSFFSFPLKEVWHYRDLLFMFVKRDVVTVYKQTILGPIWFVVQPILTTCMYIIVFGYVANIPTDGVPKILFYLSGIIIWTYFADSFNSTANTFRENEGIFGKVYFPRLISPFSKIISGLLKFGIQFIFLLLVICIYALTGTSVHFTWHIVLLPYLVFLMACLGLGSGIIFTSLTAKYRDLTFLISFGVQLLMYATPIIYPMSSVPEKFRGYILANPITPIVEAFRFVLFDSGTLNLRSLGYSTLFCLFLLFTGTLIFNRTERTFMDTV